jgi:sugar O-acyltransferase (sialic acid O-acetyltransferase NeuD family)
MLIVGAKGYAKELLQHFHNNNKLNDLVFYDDVSSDLPSLLFNKFKVLRSIEEVKDFFKTISNKYVLGVGSPKARFLLKNKMDNVGGTIEKVIVDSVEIGSYGVNIGNGVNIMSGTIITNDINIGDCTLINLNCTIGHDSIIGNYCELSPGVHISGHVEIGDFTSIGTGAVIIPHVKIGKNCIIGAGSVVNKDIPDNSIAVGVPAKVIKEVEPFNG